MIVILAPRHPLARDHLVVISVLVALSVLVSELAASHTLVELLMLLLCCC